ncbi:MAG: DUF5690 family protein [Pirellulaceae bacterium]|nr:hypothetical protein [Planctomycetales bacterium]
MSEVGQRDSFITRKLRDAPAAVFNMYAVFFAFWTYFCMYAFRKPFAAAKYTDMEGFSVGDRVLELKTALIISQIIGYALSKFLGIKICSEVTKERRATMLIGLILIAQLALLLFAFLPAHWKVLPMFINGLALGMVWGLVVWYLEGRRTSELLLAGLSCSFILASGEVKQVGQDLLNGTSLKMFNVLHLPIQFSQVSEDWMPFYTGMLFLTPFVLSVLMLHQVPDPSVADVESRTKRVQMQHDVRFAFMRKFFPGLVMLLIAYFFLTAYRDFRDNYMPELFSELGYSYDENKGIITQTEQIVSFGVLMPLALLFLIKDNRRGLIAVFGIMSFGVALMAVSTWLFDQGVITGFAWMIATGLGVYLAYVPYGSVLFDRLIASTRVVATAVFAIYVADAIGYVGSVGLQLHKDLGAASTTRLGFFHGFTYFMAGLGLVMLLLSCGYFLTFHVPRRSSPGNGNTEQ